MNAVTQKRKRRKEVTVMTNAISNVLSCSLVDVYKTGRCIRTFQRNPILMLESAGSSVISIHIYQSIHNHILERS